MPDVGPRNSRVPDDSPSSPALSDADKVMPLTWQDTSDPSMRTTEASVSRKSGGEPPKPAEAPIELVSVGETPEVAVRSARGSRHSPRGSKASMASAAVAGGGVRGGLANITSNLKSQVQVLRGGKKSRITFGSRVTRVTRKRGSSTDMGAGGTEAVSRIAELRKVLNGLVRGTEPVVGRRTRFSPNQYLINPRVELKYSRFHKRESANFVRFTLFVCFFVFLVLGTWTTVDECTVENPCAISAERVEASIALMWGGMAAAFTFALAAECAPPLHTGPTRDGLPTFLKSRGKVAFFPYQAVVSLGMSIVGTFFIAIAAVRGLIFSEVVPTVITLVTTNALVLRVNSFYAMATGWWLFACFVAAGPLVGPMSNGPTWWVSYMRSVVIFLLALCVNAWAGDRLDLEARKAYLVLHLLDEHLGKGAFDDDMELGDEPASAPLQSTTQDEEEGTRMPAGLTRLPSAITNRLSTAVGIKKPSQSAAVAPTPSRAADYAAGGSHLRAPKVVEEEEEEVTPAVSTSTLGVDRGAGKKANGADPAGSGVDEENNQAVFIDLDAPVVKTLALLDTIAESFDLSPAEVNLLDEVRTALTQSASSLWSPNLQEQLHGTDLDSDMRAWLFYELAKEDGGGGGDGAKPSGPAAAGGGPSDPALGAGTGRQLPVPVAQPGTTAGGAVVEASAGSGASGTASFVEVLTCTMDQLKAFALARPSLGVSSAEVMALDEVRRRMQFWEFDDTWLTGAGLDASVDAVGVHETFDRHGPKILSWFMIAAAESYGLLEHYGVSDAAFAKLLTTIERGYHEVPYHCLLHAIDTVQTVYWMLKHGGGDEGLGKPHIFAVLLAAACHDIGHPGKNNNFLSNTRHHLALLYNDRSVLENMHAATCVRLLSRPEFECLDKLNLDDAKVLRELMVETILGTDLAVHFENLGKFNTKLHSTGFDISKTADRNLMLSTLMHLADVSCPAKTWGSYRGWLPRLFQEFFDQGDDEVKLGFDVAPFMDRRVSSPAKAQIGFCNIIVSPLFEAVAEVVPGLKEKMEHLENTLVLLSRWEENGYPSRGHNAPAAASAAQALSPKATEVMSKKALPEIFWDATESALVTNVPPGRVNPTSSLRDSVYSNAAPGRSKATTKGSLELPGKGPPQAESAMSRHSSMATSSTVDTVGSYRGSTGTSDINLAGRKAAAERIRKQIVDEQPAAATSSTSVAAETGSLQGSARDAEDEGIAAEEASPTAAE